MHKIWKTSCIVPLPKKGHSSAHDFRSVALTSRHKELERLVLRHLRSLVRDCLDPLQFVYQADISVEDAIIYLLHRASAHLEKPQRSTVRMMFFAFNTRLALRLAEKLSVMDLVFWITDYFTDRPQYDSL
ncbi:hypothetical protein LDENG_00200560 [Lucifuga dentata]|nr:hypothetical protein LDENG_00200560 [Lucifuga dentata]